MDAALRSEAAALRQELEAHYGRPLAFVIARQRYLWAARLAEGLIRRRPGAARERWRRRFEALTLHPVWGWLVIAAARGMTYEVVGVFGAQILVRFLEETVFGAWLLPALAWLAERWIPWPLLIVAAVLGLLGHLAARLIPGETSEFILELPPLRIPRLDNLFLKTMARLE